MAAPRVLVLSTSLNPSSNSRKLARLALERMQAGGARAHWMDLRDLDLPICDGGDSYEHPDVARLKEQTKAADGILIATGIYNYAVTAACKNAVEFAGRTLTEKVVGFLCSAGGRHSYMSVMNLANSMMLDFRSVIVPRFVYAPRGSFSDEDISDPEVIERVGECADELVRMTAALRSG